MTKVKVLERIVTDFCIRSNGMPMKNCSIKTILFLTDFLPLSDNALPIAIYLAKKANAKLVIVNILGNFILSKTVADSLKYVLNKMAREIKAQGVIVEQYQLQGALSENIIRAIYLYAADILVIGASERNGILETVNGANAHEIINNSSIPVLSVSANKELKKINQIIFPLNEDLLALENAAEIIELAELYNAEILILGVMSDIGKMSVVENHVIQLDHLLSKRKIKFSRRIIHASDYIDEVRKFCHARPGTVLTVMPKTSNGNNDLLSNKMHNRVITTGDVSLLTVPALLE